MKIVIATGGFDPLHSGHINYLKEAKKLGDQLIVGVNSDEWLERKKGKSFMSWKERSTIVEALGCVDHVIDFDDHDNTAIDAIYKVKKYNGPNCEIVFANGGDRDQYNIPEYEYYHQDMYMEFKFGVGGEKTNASSKILKDYKDDITVREWGSYRVLHNSDKKNVKVKELTVEPGKSLSMQRHDKRSEHWFISEGQASVYTLNVSTDVELQGRYNVYDNLHINVGQWHQLVNESGNPLRIVEIQYGETCQESDIERKII